MKTNSSKCYAMVTGASRGLGRAITESLASSKVNLLLVSLPGEGLPAFCEHLMNRYSIDAAFYEADMVRPDTVYEIARWAGYKYRVNILVNNAGIGGTKCFEDASPSYIDNIIQINVRATSLLTRLMLPELKSNRPSYILNVSSIASFCPCAYKTVYPASKTFIYSFSRGLRQELAETGVSVTVLCPGAMATNPDIIKRINSQGWKGRIGAEAVEKVARIGIRGMLDGKSAVVPGWSFKIQRFLMAIVPYAYKLAIFSQVAKKELRVYDLPYPVLTSPVKQFGSAAAQR